MQLLFLKVSAEPKRAQFRGRGLGPMRQVLALLQAQLMFEQVFAPPVTNGKFSHDTLPDDLIEQHRINLLKRSPLLPD